jgi:hypothetical protein
MTLVAFVLVVNRTGGASCNCSNRRPRTASDDGPDRRAASCTYANSGDSSAHTMASMVAAMIDHGRRAFLCIRNLR